MSREFLSSSFKLNLSCVRQARKMFGSTLAGLIGILGGWVGVDEDCGDTGPV